MPTLDLGRKGEKVVLILGADGDRKLIELDPERADVLGRGLISAARDADAERAVTDADVEGGS